MSTNDVWTLRLDELGMESTGDALARLILTCRPPYAICVQGKWGSGKTSLMRYAMARLGGRPLTTVLETSNKPTSELPEDLHQDWETFAKLQVSEAFILQQLESVLLTRPRDLRKLVQIVPIWFNPWQHQNAPLPVVALLQEMRRQFSLMLKLHNKTSKLSQVAVEAGLSMIGDLIDAFSVLSGGPRTGALRGSGGTIRKTGEAFEERHFETLHDAQRLNLLFREAVSRLLRREKEEDRFPLGRSGEPVALRRLVIFIDDLDRCAESQTVHLLEAIKLYLQTPHCVFVFGMDASAARRAVRGQLDQGDEVAREYLEKLFQSTLYVPLPTYREAFVARQLVALGVAEDADDPGTKHLAKTIFTMVEPNPRKLKNFINTFAAGRQAYDGLEGFSQVHYLLVTYLRCYHPDVYRLISYDFQAVATLHEVISSEELLGERSSPAQHFFHRAFRHSFKTVTGFGEDGPSRADSDLVVDELTERLDRRRSDRAFCAHWIEEFDSAQSAKHVALTLKPYLHADGDVP